MIKKYSQVEDMQRNYPLPGRMERAVKLREVFEALREVNKDTPVIVEGKKDALALRKLGLSGDILILHSGQNMYDFCEDILEKFARVIVLLDWDDRGEKLDRTLCNLLKGHWEEFSAFREILKILCQKDIKDIEGIPKLLRRLEESETHWQ